MKKLGKTPTAKIKNFLTQNVVAKDGREPFQFFWPIKFK